MQCRYPFQIKINNIPKIIPCGKCLSCLRVKAKEYAQRIINEYSTFQGKAIVITLTYNDENNKPLSSKDILNFKNKLKKKYKIKYFICGEYGAKTLRAHYHGIIFGINLNNIKAYKYGNYWKSDILNKIWNKGEIIIDIFNEKCAYYITKYVIKNNGWKRSSTNLGLKFLIDNTEEILKSKSICRYYIKKLQDMELLTKHTLSINRFNHAKEIAKQNKINMQKSLKTEQIILDTKYKILYNKNISMLRRDYENAII